jgi:REP-associated tyrosine transposase
MPSNLKRYHQSGHSHFITFTCYHRLPYLQDIDARGHFISALERVRVRYGIRVYGFVVMPEHVHLLISESERATVATAIQALKISSSKRAAESRGSDRRRTPFWQKRYYDRNIRDYEEFAEKLRYLHRNPIKRGLVENPADWKWSSFRHYATGEDCGVEIESQWTADQRSSTGANVLRTPHLPTEGKCGPP